MKNNEKRGKPTKWNLSFQRAAIDLTLDCCEIWQRFKTRDVEKTNKSKRETENMSKASIYDDPHVQTAVYFRLAKNPVSRKISFNMNPTAERSIILVDFRNGIIARRACEIMSHDLATTRTYHANGNKQNFT